MANTATFEFLCAALSLALWFSPFALFASQTARQTARQTIGVTGQAKSLGGTGHDH